MRFYAEKPVRATAQVLRDLAVLVWIVGWMWAATQVHEAMMQWQAPGQRLLEAGGGLQRTFGDAARSAGGVPFVGRELAGVLDGGTAAGDVLADAGRTQIDVVGYSATAVAIALVVLALVPVLLFWLPRRVRYARATGNAVAMRSEARDLLALQALTELPYGRLKKVSANPADAWRRGDGEVIGRLAGMRLDALGLRSPGHDRP